MIVTKGTPKKPAAPGRFITRSEIARALTISNGDAEKWVTSNKLVPVHVEAFGAGTIKMFDREAVAPVLAAAVAKKFPQKAPSPAITTTGDAAQIKALGLRLDVLRDTMAEQLGDLTSLMTKQNAALLHVVEKQSTQIAVLLKQLGVAP